MYLADFLIIFTKFYQNNPFQIAEKCSGGGGGGGYLFKYMSTELQPIMLKTRSQYLLLDASHIYNNK
jgi:hypothetical protein